MTIAFHPEFAAKGDAHALRWRRHLILLAASWAALLAIFHRDVADLAEIYWNSTTYGHCLFVLPVVGWLVWQRRDDLAKLTLFAWWPGLALVGAGAFGWLIGDAAAVGLFRHAGLVLMLQGAVVTLLGPQVARGMLFPLFYLSFLIPFGDFLEKPLQDLTVAMIMPLLHAFGVPATVDGVLIYTPSGVFEVAEACSGSKFVIAMVAYGALVANVCFVSWRRRAAFLAMAFVVPMIANGVRAWGTIYAAWWTSIEQATGMDHIVYGWVFFAAVMAAVLAIGWHWFDRDPDAAWFDAAALDKPVTRRIDAVTATGAVLGIPVLFAIWASVIAQRADALPAQIALPEVPGWQRVPMNARAPWTPYYPNADHFLIGRYGDGQGRAVDLAIAVYDSQREGKELIAFGQGAIREEGEWIRVQDLPSIAGGSAVRMTRPGPVERDAVTWYRVGDVLSSSAKAVKLETLKNRMLGGPQSGVAILVSAERIDGSARDEIEAFLSALGPLDTLGDTAAGRAD